MPTGYTWGIEKGMTFEQFVWGCARAFGALILMRDTPMSTPVPEQFEISTYHQEHLDKIAKELHDVKSLSPMSCDLKANDAYLDERTRIESIIEERLALQLKYTTILAKVEAWTPPSPDHEELKAFMLSQLQQSIEWDCSLDHYWKDLENLKKKSGAEWREDKIKELLHMKDYHITEQAKDIKRTEGRNSWIRQLRESVPQPEQMFK